MSSKKIKDEFAHLIGVQNAWIDPDGKFIPVGYMCHNEWATDYMEQVFKLDFSEIVDLINKHKCDYPYEYLCKVKGWIRLMNWTGRGEGFHLVGYSESQKPNQAQKDTVFLWCAKNGYNYENLF
jgi:hypothetical protein